MSDQPAPLGLAGTTLHVTRGDGTTRLVALDALVSPDIEEAAADEANRWIKQLRHLRVGGASLRDRFTHRGDSLWWFIELYLHKRGRIVDLMRLALAFDALMAEQRPRALAWRSGEARVGFAVGRLGAAHGIEVAGAPARPPTLRERLSDEFRSWAWTVGAMLSRLRRRSAPRDEPARIAAYIHSAFWQPGRGPVEEGRETYLGPVLQALQAGGRSDRVALVGLGPRTNFRARRWWHALVGSRPPQGSGVTPIEDDAPLCRITPSLALWRQRRRMVRTLLAEEVREQVRLRGCDVWPLVREELRGALLLQLPWSARAMDEAGASLDRLSPAIALTYAEAGGWGRALALEARRRGIALVGLQHGFIYRHWLNYRHEPDEMEPSPVNAADRGFPRPDLTLVFDGFARTHLEQAGNFPRHALEVIGSPSLETLASGRAAVGAELLARTRARVELAPGDHVVLVVSKQAQIGPWLGALVDAARPLDDVRIVIKPHPAEAPAAYQALAAEPTVRIAPADVELPVLVTLARLLVTRHSTVGIDAMALGVPVLVLGAPSNLAPFVDAGAMAGAPAGRLPETLARLLRDERARAAQMERGRQFAARHQMVPGRAAAEQAAAAIHRLAGRSQPR